MRIFSSAADSRSIVVAFRTMMIRSRSAHKPQHRYGCSIVVAATTVPAVTCGCSVESLFLEHLQRMVTCGGKPQHR